MEGITSLGFFSYIKVTLAHLIKSSQLPFLISLSYATSQDLF